MRANHGLGWEQGPPVPAGLHGLVRSVRSLKSSILKVLKTDLQLLASIGERRGPVCQKTSHNGTQKHCIGPLCTRRIKVDQFAQLNGLTTSPLRAPSWMVPMIPSSQGPAYPPETSVKSGHPFPQRRSSLEDLHVPSYPVGLVLPCMRSADDAPCSLPPALVEWPWSTSARCRLCS